MDIIIECVKCECCGLKEDCTKEYISDVKSKFEGKWLCGLCSEAVTYELTLNRSSSSGKRRINKQLGLEEAVKSHMSFCRKDKSNPAFYVADGMRQMLRRRSGDLSSSSSSPPNSSSSKKKYSRSLSTSHVRM